MTRIRGRLSSLRLIPSWLLATEVEAGELDDRLRHLHFDAVNFFGIVAYCQPAVDHDFASFDDALQDALTKTVTKGREVVVYGRLALSTFNKEVNGTKVEISWSLLFL